MLELEQDSKRQILKLEISQLIDGGQTSHDFNRQFFPDCFFKFPNLNLTWLWTKVEVEPPSCPGTKGKDLGKEFESLFPL